MRRWLPILILLAGAGFVGSQLARRGGSQGTDPVVDKSGPKGPGATPGVAPVWLGLQFEKEGANGLKVRHVFEGSPAAKAGIVAGDLIVTFRGAALRRATVVQEALQHAKEGDEFLFEKKTSPDDDLVAVKIVASSNAGIDGLLALTIMRGVKALVDLQKEDGLWIDWESPRPGVAVSALACAALSAAGTSSVDSAADALDRGLKTLLARRGKDGGLDDVEQEIAHRVYANACLVLALPPGKAPPEIIEWIAHAQITGTSELSQVYGGFRYYGDDRRADISVSAWALEALERGLPDNRPEWDRANRFVERSQNLEVLVDKGEEPYRDGGFAFSPVLSKAGWVDVGKSAIVHKSYGSATADGVRALVALLKIRDDATGPALRDVRAAAALRWLATNYAVDRVPGFPETNPWSHGLHLYYLCSLARALHGAHVQKLAGHDWPDELARVLAQRQDPNSGSFSTPNGLMGEDSPVVATSIALLALAAARDEKFFGAGVPVEAGPAVVPPPIEPWAPGTVDLVESGRVGFQQRDGCISCHVDNDTGSGPTLVGVADRYLEAFRTRDRARDYFKKHLRDPKKFRGLRVLRGREMPNLTLGDEEIEVLVEFLLSRVGNEPVSEARAPGAPPRLGSIIDGGETANDKAIRCSKCHTSVDAMRALARKPFDLTKHKPPFSRPLSPKEIADLTAWVKSFH